MPVQEDILAGSRRKPRHRRRIGASRRSHRMHGYLGIQWVMLALLFVITGTLITVALVLSHSDGGHGTCTGSWPPVCSHSAPG